MGNGKEVKGERACVQFRTPSQQVTLVIPPIFISRSDRSACPSLIPSLTWFIYPYWVIIIHASFYFYFWQGDSDRHDQARQTRATTAARKFSRKHGKCMWHKLRRRLLDTIDDVHNVNERLPRFTLTTSTSRTLSYKTNHTRSKVKFINSPVLLDHHSLQRLPIYSKNIPHQ